MKNCNNRFAFKAMYVFVALVLFVFGIGVNGVEGQTFNLPSSGSNTWTTCSGTLYDNGGTGDYTNSCDGYTTIYPSIAGNKVSLTGSFVTETNYDYVTIFDGVGTSGAILYATTSGTQTIPTITSTAADGSLTVRFTSDGSVVYAGITFTVSCVPPPSLTVPSSGSNTYTTCSATLYDAGGSAGNYDNNWNGYSVIYPATAGSKVQISGTTSGESCCDYIRVYDGTSTSAALLGQYQMGTAIPILTSSDASGALTIQFYSDVSVTGAGFEISISCYTPAPMTVPSSGSNSYTVCSGNLYDAGGSAGNYADNWNGYTVLYPSTVGNLMQISGTTSGESCCDYIRVYDGTSTSATLLGQYQMGTAIPTLTSSDASGALTVQFYSDGSITGAGFNIAISCYTPPACVTCPTYNFSITPTTTWQTHSNSVVAGGCKKYSVNLIAGNTYLFSACAADGGTASYDTYFTLYNSSCTLVANNDDNCGLQSYISYTPTSTETYYFEVNSCCTGGSSGTYTLAYRMIPETTPPTLDAITVNNSCWITDDRHVYSIICQTSDESGIGGPTYGTMALINYQGASAGSYGGYFGWNTSIAALNAGGYTLDQCEAVGGGYVGKYNGYGNTTITLVGGSTSVSGNQRTVTFNVRPNNTFPVLSANDISLYSSDIYGNVAGWVNFETNFSSQTTQQITCPSNVDVCGSQVVSYSAPTSTCNTSVALNAGLASGSTFPIGSNTVTYNTFYPNGAGGNFNYAPSATNQQIALAACESVYGVGNCSIGTCGSFTYYYQTGALSCNCTKPVGSYEFIYSNTGYTQVGQDYGGKSTDVAGNSLFTRVKTSSGCDGNSWSLAQPALGQGGASCSFNVNVVPAFSSGALTGPATSTQCYNFNPTVLTANPTGGTGTYNYQWQNSLDGSTWNDISGATASTYDPPALTSSTLFRVLVDPTGTPDCAGATASTNTLVYTIRPNFTPGAINTTGETICYNGNPGIIGSTTASSGGDNNITYEWRANGTPIGSTNSATYDPPANLTTTTTYTRWAKDANCSTTFTQSTGSWLVTVRPEFTPGAINTTGETICYNGNPGIIGSTTASSGGDNSITYEWRANGTAIPSSNSATYDPPAGLTTTTTYTRWAHDGTCNTSWEQSTGSWVVTVLPAFDPGTISSVGETICMGADPVTILSIADAQGGDGNISYYWKIGTFDDFAQNVNELNPVEGLLQTTTFLRFAKDNTCSTLWTQSAGSWQVTVTPAPVPAGMIAGDYLWTGDISNSWNNPCNWIHFDGSDYLADITVPNINSNVFIQEYAGTCATTIAKVDNSQTAQCKNINIISSLNIDFGSVIEVSGNWVNESASTVNLGEVIFNGSTHQIIEAGGVDFSDVTFNNSSLGSTNIEITDPMNILGLATFTDGIVYYTGSGSLTFGNTSFALVSSNNSFVNGSVTKTGSSNFVFPIGDISSHDFDGNGFVQYQVLGAIQINPLFATNTTAEFYFSNTGMPDWWEHSGNMDATLHHVSDREHWIINADQNMDNITLYWYDNGHAVGAICPHGFDFGDQSDFVASDLTVTYWSGSVWRDAGGVVSGDHDNGSITSALTIPFGSKAPKYITFGSKNNLNPLPVELTYFTGNCKNGTTEFNWQTASETNNSHFLVQVSNNMKDFETIGKIEGAGNSSVTTNYDFSGKAVFESSYYRLIQVDFDGKTKIYPPIQITCKESNLEPSLSVYPNPFNSEISIILEHLATETAKVEVLNSIGQVVFESEIEIANGFASNTFDFRNLKPGMYQLRIISGARSLGSKIIKK